MQCPKCNSELSEEVTICYICGAQISEQEVKWVCVGYVDNVASAGLVEETMKSCNIPAVIISKSGFFGSVGLTLNPFFSSASAQFEIKVPSTFIEEATEVLDATLGDNWNRNLE